MNASSAAGKRADQAWSSVITESAVEKHVSKIFEKLDLSPSDADHCRVLAVLAYLRAAG